MLVQFSVANYLSFKEKVTLSMVKSALHELPENVITINNNFELVKSAIVYGANASGKSNLISALSFMRFFTLASFKLFQQDEEIGIINFLLNEETLSKPSFFEIVFIIEKIIYRYGFEVDNKKVCKEWLYSQLKKKEKKLFERDGSKFYISDEFSEGKGDDIQSLIRENCLILTLGAHLNRKISTAIIKWFRKIHIVDMSTLMRYTLERLEEEPALKNDSLQFTSVADSGIDDIAIETVAMSSEQIDKNMLQKEKKDSKKKVYLIKKVFNGQKKVVNEKIRLPLGLWSEGTAKMFAFSVPIIDALRNGEIIIVDELESHLHALLYKYIIKIFNSYSNKNNAQLIVTTHNVICMNSECFRRDQIWFTEKNSFGESELFSLADYKIDDKKIRNDASYSKDYLLGKYGAIPFINEITMSFEEQKNE
jgi:AAA15 family ATPase/GTPase